MATITIDGKKIDAESGQMIIEVADEVGISIPRFCYHKKLSVAANCRMCLVEVERSGKPLPACATPVTDGMVVHTKSKFAVDAQKSVMEFLLINHPLDCPICDQGGECELQDVSMGFGSDVSTFTEGKRAVEDDDLGSLISTEMTRCIHCTRCVRFGEEVAGLRELGATGRGEDTKIGTFIKHSVSSPVSGNIIDLCPVGALTSKPYRFTARAWELKQYASIAPHDCLGSNIFVHTLKKKVRRVVPRENESINETWLSDRDRFAYLGLNSHERLGTPLIKQQGTWQATDWETALNSAVSSLKSVIEKSGANHIAALVSPNATVEESYLMQRLMRGIGSPHTDHRLRQTDCLDQETAPLFYGASAPYESLEEQQGILLIGSDVYEEQPLAAVRIYKAVNHGAAVGLINARDTKATFDIKEKAICDVDAIPQVLAKIAKALMGSESSVPAALTDLLKAVETDEPANALANILRAEKSVVILGPVAMNHPQSAVIRSLAKAISVLSGSEIMVMTEGANSAGASLAGALPHRSVGGQPASTVGLSADAALKEKCKAYVLLGVEPEFDCANAKLALESMENADCVIAITPFVTETIKQYADVILPMAPFSETAGTFVNLDGKWQSFRPCVELFEQTKPAWKILRVLGNLFDLEQFEYNTSEEVRDELAAKLEKTSFKGEDWYCPAQIPSPQHKPQRLGTLPIYKIDGVTRRSKALQDSATAGELSIAMSPVLAAELQLKDCDKVRVSQQQGSAELMLRIDETLSDNTVYLPAGYEETASLGAIFGALEVKAC